MYKIGVMKKTFGPALNASRDSNAEDFVSCTVELSATPFCISIFTFVYISAGMLVHFFFLFVNMYHDLLRHV